MQVKTNLQEQIQNFIHVDDGDEQIEINFILQKVVGLSNNEIASINNLKGKGKQTICGAPIIQDSLFYRCFECCNEPGHVYCKACMSFEKHKGHIITYHYSNGGCCDCGDVLLNKDTWCDNHSVGDDFSFPRIGESIPMTVRLKVGEFMQTIIASIVERVECFIDLPCRFFHDSTLSCWKQLYQHFDNSLKRLSFEEMSETVAIMVKKYQESIQMYNLLISVLESLTDQNVEMSRFIAEQFLNPIDLNLQTYFRLRHIHSDGLQKQVFVGKQIQPCKCTLIQLFLKFHIFLDDDRSIRDLQQKEETLESFQTLFYSLHSHPQFKEVLCQEFAENLLLLHKPVYRFDMGKGQYLYLNQISYSENSSLNFFFQYLNSISDQLNVEKEYHVIMSSMYDYLYQLMGMFIQKISHFKYQFELIEQYGNAMKNICISSQSGQQYWWKFESKVFTMFKSDQVVNAYELLRRSLEEANQYIEFQGANIDPRRFNQHRLLIFQFFLFAFPEKALQLTGVDQESFDQCEFHILSTAIVILQMHRSLLNNLINNAPNWVQRQTIKNVFRIMISQAFQQVSAKEAPIEPQKVRLEYFKSVFGCFYVFDRWFTQLLASYYSLISNISGEEFLKELCFICNKSAAALREIFFKVLSRVVYQQFYFETSDCRHFYRGYRKIYSKTQKFFEAPISAFDCQFVQLYCFIFGQQGVCQLIDLIQSFSVVRSEEVGEQFLLKTINHLAQSDFELVHLVGSFYITPYPDFLQKGITKTCATIFCGAQFYSFRQLEEIFFEAYGIEPAINLKSVVLSCCELNHDLQKIQLKPQYKPSNNNLVYPGVKLHQYINERLLAQKQKLEFYFGTQLSEELRNKAEGRESTLSSMRTEILRSIAKNSAYCYSNVIDKLATFYAANDVKKFLFTLEQNAAHLNVLDLLIRYIDMTMQPRFLKLIESINQFMKQNQKNLSDSQTDLLKVFLERFSPQSVGQKEDMIVQRFDVKKRELQQRYKKQQFEFTQKLQENDVLNQTNTQQISCQVCSLPFEPNEIQQSLFIIQSVCNNNCVSYGPSEGGESLKLHLSGCGHELHLKCLNLSHKVKPLFGGKFGECPVCLQPYNFVLPDLEKTEVTEKLLTQSFQEYFKWMGQNENYYLRSKFKNQDQPEQIRLIVFDLIEKLIASVINQLVNGCGSFSDQKWFQILGFLLSHSNNFLNSAGFTEQLKEHINAKSEQHAFILLAQKIQGQEFNQDILKQLIMEFTMMSQTLSSFNNMDDLISSYQAYFPPNIREFYLKFGLQPCAKCNGFPLVRQKNQKQKQFICLLCKQKLCGYNCGQSEVVDIGNLNFHAQFEHCGRAIYLQLPDAKVTIMASPYTYFEHTALYQSELGEQFVLSNTLECRQQMKEFKFNKLLLVKLLKMIREETIMSYVFSKRQETYKHLEL